MIIRRIFSENFLKYRKLELSNLPTKGLITVGGANESGKSSIGETLCFGLFGRTFTLELDEPDKLIRWGESRCTVTIEFEGRDGQIYEVARYLDNEGGYGARLVHAEFGQVLAKGAVEVDRRITELVGYGYDEFIESFYLAQRELTTPHPHSHTIRVMAGIAPLTAVADDIAASSEREQAQIEATLVDKQDVDEQYQALEIDTNWLPELIQSRDQIVETYERKDSLLETLDSKARGYQKSIKLIWKKATWRRVLSLLAIFVFAVAVGGGTVWATLKFLPDSPQGLALARRLIDTFPEWELHYAPLVTPVAIIATLIFVLLNTASWILQRQRVQLKATAGELGEVLPEVKADLQAPVPDFSQAIERVLAAKAKSPPVDAISTVSGLDTLAKKVADFEATPQEVNGVVTEVAHIYTAQSEAFRRDQESLEHMMKVESDRLKNGEDLLQTKETLNHRVTDYQQRIKVYENAVHLLKSTSHHLSHRFNQSVLNLAGKALPVFTQERYQHLKIDEGLSVRVFSNEKSDFMDFDETSSGTQRQVMLSLRLAMSQELIKNNECAPQFIFFDEPFAFFDQLRIKNTLEELPKISDDIAQLWLVTQEFPEGTQSDYAVHCTHEVDELLLGVDE